MDIFLSILPYVLYTSLGLRHDPGRRIGLLVGS